MHGRKRMSGTIVVRHAREKEGNIGMREIWMHSEKGARARGRIKRWCVITVMVKTTMPVDSDSMYALAPLEFQKRDLDVMYAEDTDIRGRIAHLPVGDATHPPQAREEDRKAAKEAKGEKEENGDRDRQTSVEVKGERECQHSSSGLDKIKTKICISIRVTSSINGRHQVTPQDRGHSNFRTPHHGSEIWDSRRVWGCIVLKAVTANSRDDHRIGKYKIKEEQLGL